MKKLFLTSILTFIIAASVSAQPKTGETIARQLRSIGAEKTITLSYDEGSGVSKLMAVSGNFASSETRKAGLQAMNFAVGFYYLGKDLAAAPDKLKLTFWIMAKKPRYAADHTFTVTAGDEMLVMGGGRYTAKPRENMEYLNFEVDRGSLAKIAGLSDVTFRLGDDEFTFSRDQLKIFADMLTLSDPKQ